MQAVGFIGNWASGVLCFFSFFFPSFFPFFFVFFFTPSLYDMMRERALEIGFRGCLFIWGGEYIIPGSFSHSLFVYKATCMRIPFSLYPSSQRHFIGSIGCKKEEKKKKKGKREPQVGEGGSYPLGSIGLYWFYSVVYQLHYCTTALLHRQTALLITPITLQFISFSPARHGR